MITITSHPHRGAALRVLVTATLALVAALALAGPAAAAKSCGQKVVDDWYDNGRVDGTYDLHCYDDAIEILPRDVLDYSSAREDITRALQARMNGRPAPPATTDPTPGSTTDTDGGLLPGGTPDDRDGDGIANDEDPAPNRPGDERGVPEAGASDVDTSSSSSSVPVPLLVLAGLALLLVAAGSLGYVTRRLQARRGTPAA